MNNRSCTWWRCLFPGFLQSFQLWLRFQWHQVVSLWMVQHPSWCISCLVLVCSSTFDSEILSFSGCWRSRWTVVWRCQHAHPRKLLFLERLVLGQVTVILLTKACHQHARGEGKINWIYNIRICIITTWEHWRRQKW